MFPLLETIKVKNGILHNLPFHQERLDRSRFELLDIKDTIDLKSIIDVPDTASRGIFKCRVVYGKTVGKIEFIPYQPKKVKTLKVVDNNEIDYNFKYSDRSKLDELLLQKGGCDDILIVKSGLITDTSSANIVIFNGTEWQTPDQPLLKGTMRTSLLASGKIKTAQIKIDDLNKFTKFALINAMLGFDEGAGLAIENIKCTS